MIFRKPSTPNELTTNKEHRRNTKHNDTNKKSEMREGRSNLDSMYASRKASGPSRNIEVFNLSSI